MKLSKQMLCLTLFALGLITPPSTAVFAQAPPAKQHAVRIRFIDSVTGYAVQPESVVARPEEFGAEKRLVATEIARAGRSAWTLARGRHTIMVVSSAHRPMSGGFEMRVDNPYNIDFYLDPLVEPREVQSDYVATLHREDETMFVGFVVGDESGEPLENVVVRSEPSGVETRTDGRGYFQLYVPVQTLEEAKASPAKLTFKKPGHKTEERQYLELWSEGDWIYRIRLESGTGEKIVDERQLRRRTHYPLHVKGDEKSKANAGEPKDARDSAPASIQSSFVAGPSLRGGSSTPPPVRVPTNIRVLRQDGTTIDYISLQTYCQRSLPSEWIASWGSTGPGNRGTNSLNAGAVAVRTYAIGFVNNPSSSTYDICGTTSCQVYNNTASDSRTTAAVNYTANFVMLEPGATRIAFKLTEYSAENNSLGFSCGDGYTQPNSGCVFDPVCTGEARFGHGKGMCQWGTARWASGRRMMNRNTSDAVTNGYPLQDWIWLCEHYYPTLALVQGAPLMMNDYVKVLGTASLTVRECAGGNIANGTSCPQITAKASGATGVIVGGPVRVTIDGIGYTWWRVQWHDAGPTIGWSPENWLERTTEPLNVPPVLAPIADMIVNEGALLTFTNSAIASANADVLITDFESFASGTANGTVMFRHPSFSGSTDEFLDASPSITSVTDTFPAGNDSARVLRADWSWSTTVNAWLRLTTSGTANLPNPVIELTRKLVFDIYTDKNLKVAIGARETGNPSGPAIGSNGGTTPAVIEFAGVSDVVSGQPQATRTVIASNWTTLVFDLPNESIRNFSGGNGVLSTGTGLGVLEHLAFAPASGAGAYDVYLDNFVVSTPKVLTYSLSNAPAGATLNATNGVFSWTPTEAQGAGIYSITVKVTDNNLPPLSDMKSFQVTVNEVNQAPVLAAIASRTVHAGTLVTFTNSASDADIPTNVLSFSLDAGAPATAVIGTNNGVFAWLTGDADAGTTNNITVRVTDNGVPPMNDAKSFSVTVMPKPVIQSPEILGGNLVLTWSAINGATYRVQFKNNLDDPVWTDLVSDVPASGASASKTDPFGPTQRFYRVLVVAQ